MNEQEFLVQKIKSAYTEKQHTDLDELRRLDKKVKRPANVFAYTFGSLAAIIMGCGMSLVMTDLAETLGIAKGMALGVIVGIIGLSMAIANYPIFKKYLSSRRKKYADQIIALSEKLMK